MNLQQVKQDVDNGAIISKATWLRVLEAALMMQSGLHGCIDHGHQSPYMIAVLDNVEAL